MDFKRVGGPHSCVLNFHDRERAVVLKKDGVNKLEQQRKGISGEKRTRGG